jgi:hypothetical protein
MAARDIKLKRGLRTPKETDADHADLTDGEDSKPRSKPRKDIMKKLMNNLSGYENLLGDIAGLLESARRSAARSVNALMTATYWLIGRRIVEFEQAGAARAEYGAELLKRLSGDLASRFGRGFSERNLDQMRLFYLNWNISQTVSAEISP